MTKEQAGILGSEPHTGGLAIPSTKHKPPKNLADGMIKALKPGGRLCIITFHSLEDRIVKRAFRTAEDPCICPKDFPICICGRKSLGKVISKKAILPSDLEREENPRSKSAKLRIFERGE